MGVYEYSGPVKMFDMTVSDNWHGETTAVSESKARSNLTYQYKKQTGRNKTTKVTLPGKIILVG